MPLNKIYLDHFGSLVFQWNIVVYLVNYRNNFLRPFVAGIAFDQNFEYIETRRDRRSGPVRRGEKS